METTKIKEFRWVTSDWALQEVFIGAVNVPFQVSPPPNISVMFLFEIKLCLEIFGNSKSIYVPNTVYKGTDLR